MRKAEVFISSFTAVGCISLTLYLSSWLSTFQTLWPFPALYLIELVILSVVAWFFSFRDLPHAAMVIWAVAGAFLGFSVLAGFSIGFFYFPIVLLWAAVATLSDLKRKKVAWTHIGMLFIGVLAQTAIILLILQFVFKTPLIN